jgi:Mn-dependent DtxR family transcriptional regulator
MDARSSHGSWTRPTLRLIGECEGEVSTTLAERLGRDRTCFKADVRKLKALGLTESLETGYRLTALGRKLAAL